MGRIVSACAAAAVFAAAMTIVGTTRVGAASGVDQLGWLAGCWTSERGDRRIDEQWMKPLGATMLGMSRTVAGGKTVEFELLQIRERDGEIFYIAKPSGQPEASFKLVLSKPEEVRFENAAHDFPQRIIYRLGADGTLNARIEGTSNGKPRAIDFPPMTRGAC